MKHPPKESKILKFLQSQLQSSAITEVIINTELRNKVQTLQETFQASLKWAMNFFPKLCLCYQFFSQ